MFADDMLGSSKPGLKTHYIPKVSNNI